MARTEEWRRLEGRAYRGFSMSWLIGKCSWGLLLPAVAYWFLADAGMAACGPSCMFGRPLSPIRRLSLWGWPSRSAWRCSSPPGRWATGCTPGPSSPPASSRGWRRRCPGASKSSPRTRNCREAPSSSPMAKRPSGHAPTGSPVGCEAPAWRCAKRPSALPRAESSRDSPSVRPGSRCGPWPTREPSAARPRRRLLPADAVVRRMDGDPGVRGVDERPAAVLGRLPFRGGRRQVRDVGRRRFAPKGRAS